MYIRHLSLLALTVLAVSVSISCGDKKDDPGVPISTVKPAPPALVAGTSQNLPKSDKLPKYHLDRIGAENNPDPKKTVQVAADSSIMFMGWAIDDTTKQLPGGVDIAIDQSVYSAHAGTNRSDVADYFKRPELATAGFELIVPAGQLSKGEHTATIRVISSDKKSYFQTETWKFVVN
jgi:hypothetical protein